VIATQINLLDPNADRLELVSAIREASSQLSVPIVMTVVDTVSRAFAGGEENSSEDMGAFVRNIDSIRDLTQSHVMGVHHSGKDATRGARGHSLLRAATDHELEVLFDETTGIRELTIRKQRDMPAGGSFSFRLKSVTVGESPDGKEVTSCVVEAVGDSLPKPRPKLPESAYMALTKLDDLLAREGTPAPSSNHIPQNVTVTFLERFRNHLRDTGVTDEKGGPTERQQWKRIKEKLINLKYIAVWKEHVWKIP